MGIRRGVICASGSATRLNPLSKVTSKHLLPIYSEPMIHYGIRTLVQAGITEICLIVGGTFAGSYLQLLGNGEDFGLKRLEYVYQRTNNGIAGALALTEGFADGEDIVCLLGDNLFDQDFSSQIENFDGGATVFLKGVDDPERFGVPVFDVFGEIYRIDEKPLEPRSPFAVVGLYIFDNMVYDIIRKLEPSARGELEITDVNNAYIRMGELNYEMVEGPWFDAGSFHSLFKANEYWANKAMKED